MRHASKQEALKIAQSRLTITIMLASCVLAASTIAPAGLPSTTKVSTTPLLNVEYEQPRPLIAGDICC